MRLKLVVSLLLLGTCSAIGQNKNDLNFDRITVLADASSAPSLQNWDIQIPDTLCSSTLNLFYDLCYITDTVQQTRHHNRVVLQMSDNWIKYFVLRRHLQDVIHTKLTQIVKGNAPAPNLTLRYEMNEEEQNWNAVAGSDDLLNGEIWTDCNESQITERLHDYDRANLSLEYTECLPELSWAMQPGQDTICGYDCRIATARFRGRIWKAWYAPDIPANAGPWKFNGLPGVILKVEDSQRHFCWVCVAINQNPSPIIRYVVPVRKFSRDKLMHYIQSIHRAPLSLLGHGGASVYYSKKTKTMLDNSWTVPYNPIERE